MVLRMPGLMRHGITAQCRFATLVFQSLVGHQSQHWNERPSVSGQGIFNSFPAVPNGGSRNDTFTFEFTQLLGGYFSGRLRQRARGE